MHQSLCTINPRAARTRAGFYRRGSHGPGARRLRLLRDEAGLTLLEIMIVLAIIALIMGLVVGPMVMRQFGTARRDIAVATVGKYVNEAYPMWAQANPDKVCPPSLEALAEFANGKGNKDPWGQPYRLLCGPTLPPGVSGLAVVSSGPDQQADTADDIKSW